MGSQSRQAVKIGNEWKFLDAESDEDGDVMGDLNSPRMTPGQSGSGKSGRGAYSGNSRAHTGDPFYLGGWWRKLRR